MAKSKLVIFDNVVFSIAPDWVILTILRFCFVLCSCDAGSRVMQNSLARAKFCCLFKSRLKKVSYYMQFNWLTLVLLLTEVTLLLIR
jgi:hypothetical protein